MSFPSTNYQHCLEVGLNISSKVKRSLVKWFEHRISSFNRIPCALHWAGGDGNRSRREDF